MTMALPVVSFRFPDELQRRIARYAAALSEAAGVEIPQTRVVVRLIELGLEQVEKDKPQRKRKK